MLSPMAKATNRGASGAEFLGFDVENGAWAERARLSLHRWRTRGRRPDGRGLGQVGEIAGAEPPPWRVRPRCDDARLRRDLRRGGLDFHGRYSSGDWFISP